MGGGGGGGRVMLVVIIGSCCRWQDRLRSAAAEQQRVHDRREIEGWVFG